MSKKMPPMLRKVMDNLSYIRMVALDSMDDEMYASPSIHRILDGIDNIREMVADEYEEYFEELENERGRIEDVLD